MFFHARVLVGSPLPFREPVRGTSRHVNPFVSQHHTPQAGRCQLFGGRNRHQPNSISHNFIAIPHNVIPKKMTDVVMTTGLV